MQQDLRQRDFSTVAIKDMSPAERAELKRRYSLFVEHFRVGNSPAPPHKPARKWVPSKRIKG